MTSPQPEPDENAAAQWSSRHHGLDASGSVWVSGWVRLTHACARPLARRGVSPDVVTGAGVVVSAAVPLVCLAGAAWPLLATALVLVAAVLDGVDGSLASQTGTASRWGQVLDPVADRCSDLLLLLALGVLGAPWWLVAAVAAVTLLLESARAHAQVAGMEGPGAVTLWERPSRVIVAVLGTALAAVASLAGPAGVGAAEVATAATGVGAALAVVGSAQLVRAVRQALTD